MVTTPTRKFILVVDPDCLEELATQPLRNTLLLVRDLMHLDPPLTIRLVFPVYLATSGQRELAANLIKGWNLPLVPLSEKTTVPALTLSRDLPRRMRERIERGAEGECRGLRLLALTNHLKADGLVTSLPSLVGARYQISLHHRVRIVPLSEFPDFVEICARGHDIPCGATAMEDLHRDSALAIVLDPDVTRAISDVSPTSRRTVDSDCTRTE